ncbi:MAG: ATP-binding cassette domain-containing protein [Acidaminococcaceae bacterium]|nr:ATP-binding cassette domain-containing protein [Acidaminococcaceae bacterium]
MINIENLTKRFGERIAVAGIDMEIKSGEIFGLLGPNGAGKTTTVRILTLLSRKNSGTVKICGYDIEKDTEKIKELIGVVPQHMSLDQDLTGRENLILQARLHHLKNKAVMEQRIDEILEFVELKDRADDKSRRYSGGMKRRLMIGMALLHQPKILFLDEPTVGLDPQVRRKMWDLIRKMNEDSMTVLLTTNYIEEADQLCKRVAITNKGRLVAIDKPEKLKEKVGRIGVEHMEADGMTNKFFDDREQAASYVTVLKTNAIVREVNLEDVFIELTGRRVNDQ